MKTNAISADCSPMLASMITGRKAGISNIGSFYPVVRWLLSAFCLLFLVSPVAVGQSDAEFRQKNVDAILKRIKVRLNDSIDSDTWSRHYELASANIEDLRKTLAQGGKITSNPVKKHHTLISDMLGERRVDFEAFYKAQIKLQKDSNLSARRLINEVGLEMINRITPKPGILTPITQARAANAKIIKQHFAELRSIDKAILYLDELMNSIKPSIRELTKRRQALLPLMVQFDSLKEGFDGVYEGRFSGNASGTIRFTIKGNSVTGTISGKYDGDPIRGKFNGTVDRFGYIDTTLTGTLTDSSPFKLGTFPFSGSIGGNCIGSSGKGKWAAQNIWAKLKGNWSTTRK